MINFNVRLLAVFALFSISIFTSCAPETPESKAQKIIDTAIKAHGADLFDQSIVEFDFRNRHYRSTRNGGSYVYERIFSDSTGTFHDSLSNNSFTRHHNGKLVQLTDKKKDSYSNSVNSVIYFAQLPFFLNDAAVNKTYLGTSEIKGQTYDKIKVDFNQEGGGKDFEDNFIYWFHQEKKTMDYLAYNYQTDGGGARFRVAYNVREVEGIRFADYINLKPTEKDNLEVETFDELYNADKLVELSRIDSENVEVSLQ
ncbi:MAG: DUF6503 family protein [Bacteroidota bacterium]